MSTTHFPMEIRAHFDLFWPTVMHPNRPRVCTFVRKGLNKQLVHFSQHQLSIYITTAGRNFFVHNVYNPPVYRENYGVQDLREALRKAEAVPGENHHIVVGDFNIHDPLWSAPGVTNVSTNEQRAEELKELIESTLLALLTPHGTVTRPARSQTTARNPDPATREHRDSPPSMPQPRHSTRPLFLVMGPNLQHQLRHVRVVEIFGISDHLPVETEFNANLVPKPTRKRRN